MIKRYEPSKKFPSGRWMVSISIRGIGKKQWSIPISKNNTAYEVEVDEKKSFWVNPKSKLSIQELELDIKKYLQFPDRKESRSLKTFGEVLKLYNEKRTWGDGIYHNLSEHLSDKDLDDIWDALKGFVKHLKTQFSRRKTRFSAATVNRHIAMAKAAVSNAYIEQRINANILHRFPTLPENNKKYRILSNEERERLYNELAPHLKPLFYFAIRVPCRLGELVNMKRDHYNRFKGLITLEDGTTKNGEGRWLPVFDEMKDYFNSVPEKSEYLFYRKDGENCLPLGYMKDGRVKPCIRTAWDNACRRSGIEGYNFHKTRQQAAMQMLYDGYSEIEVMMIGGWKSWDAFKRYVQADEIMLLKKLGKWEQDDSWKSTLAPTKIA